MQAHPEFCYVCSRMLHKEITWMVIIMVPDEKFETFITISNEKNQNHVDSWNRNIIEIEFFLAQILRSAWLRKFGKVGHCNAACTSVLTKWWNGLLLNELERELERVQTRERSPFSRSERLSCYQTVGPIPAREMHWRPKRDSSTLYNCMQSTD